jgi:transcriptional regulator with PAS, ATPase and Fis domain
VNCAALPDALVESELFGHDRGAFTAARTERVGIVEAACGGTVLLDEMGDLPAAGQAKLLRLLENRTFRRVGGVEERTADVRVIAATHKNLEGMVAAGTFRSDLYFRLNVVRVELPPLRDRPEDVSALAACFIARFNERLGRSVRGISDGALDALERHHWPGNVRELRNVIERAFILFPYMEELQPGHLPAGLRRAADASPGAGHMPADLGLPATERWLLADAMRRAHGNQVHAARLLGISRPTLRYRLRKHGLGCARREAPLPAFPPQA